MSGLKFRIHPFYILLGLGALALGKGYLFLSYTVALIIHEMGHSSAAEMYGYTLDDLRLMPYGAVISGHIEGIKPTEEIKIAVAGPIVNFVTAIIFTAIWWLVPSSYFFTQDFVYANLTTGIFNILPIFPLDGGRVFLALLRSKCDIAKSYKIVRIASLVAGIIFTIACIVSMFFGVSITLGVLGIFIFVSAVSGARTDGYKRIYSRTYRHMTLKNSMQVKELAVEQNATLGSINRKLNPSYYYRVSVLDQSLNEIAKFSETEIEDLLLKYDYSTPIIECIKSKNTRK